MESPFSLMLEKFLKATLQDYIKKDGLILDSFSLLDANLKLKNIELKSQKKEFNNIPIELLNGIIYDVNIEGSILQNNIYIELSNISLCLYIPSIEKLLYSYTNYIILKDDPSIKYSFKKNYINKLFDVISSTSFVKFKISNLFINLFVNVEGILLNFFLGIENILWKTEYKENDDKCTSHLEIKDINFSINFTEITLSNSINEIINRKGNINSECQIIKKMDLNSTIILNKYRFERNEYKDKIDLELFANFSEFNQNNKFILNIQGAHFNVSNLLIKNILSLVKKINNKKNEKSELLKSAKTKFKRIIQKKFHNKNLFKNKGYKFKTSNNLTVKTYTSIFKYLIYISLIMKQKKIIDFDLNFYICEKLISEFRFSKFKEDHVILDYLLEQNIKNYINSPPISGQSSIFLDMDNFKDLKHPTENKTLKAFMFFILEKFIICKKCLNNYASYDDFYFFQINFDTFTLDLTRKIEVDLNLYDDDEGLFDEDNEEFYITNIENSVRSIRENVFREDNKMNEDTEFFNSTNILLQLKITNFNILFYTNWKEHFLFTTNFLSLKIYNYSYIDISKNIDDIEKNINYEPKKNTGKNSKVEDDIFSNYSKILSTEKKIDNESTGDNSKNKKTNLYIIPFLKIEYNSEITLYIINKKMKKLEINIDDITLITECFGIFFTYLFIINIVRTLKENSPHLFFKTSLRNEKNKKEIKIDSSNHHIIPFEILSININRIIINFSTTNHTENTLTHESILFQLNTLIFNINNTSINFKNQEVLIGCINNFSFYDYYFYRKCLKFQTTIFNMFELDQEINFDDFKNNKAQILLKSIIIEITKKDIDNLYTFYASFISLYKLRPKFEDNEKIVLDSSNIKKNPFQNKGFQKERAGSHQFDDPNFFFKNILINIDDIIRFCLFKIDKIIVYIKLEKLRPEDVIQNNPDNIEFKHIITIINKINFGVVKLKYGFSLFATFNSIHVFHQNKFLLKLLESIIQEKKEKVKYKEKKSSKDNENNKESNIQKKETTINSERENNQEKITKFIKNFTNEEVYCTICFVKKKNDLNLYIFLPIIKVYFDYILYKTLLYFLNFEENQYINYFNLCVIDQLAIIMGLYRKKYNIADNGNIETNEKIIPISINCDIKSVELNCIEKRKIFIKLILKSLNFSLKKDFIVFSSEIKSLTDEREISCKKNIILQKRSGAHELNFTIRIDLIKRMVALIFEKARLVFLMRIINDLTEYFWRILFKDIIYKTDYDKLYSLDIDEVFANASKRLVEGKDKHNLIHHKMTGRKFNSLHKGSIFNFDKRRSSKIFHLSSSNLNYHLSNNNNSSSDSHPSKFERGSKKHFTIIETSYISDILKHKEKKPFIIEILVKDSEVALCMNSLKEEELIATISEFEFNSNPTDEQRRISLDFFNRFKHNVYVSSEEKTFDMEKINFYINIKDIKIKKAVDKNLTNNLVKYIDIVNFNSKKENKHHQKNSEIQFFSDESLSTKIGNIIVLLENKEYEDILSTMKIICIIPTMRIKLYTDIYEELMRLMFENFGEKNTIISEFSRRFTQYFSTIDFSKFDNNFQIKKFLIGQDIILLNDQCIISLYNYPSKCSFHRGDRKSPKQHNIDIVCPFGKNFPNLELEKLCEMKATNLYLLMRFFKEEKYFYMSLNDMNIELNRNMVSFSQYPCLKLLWIQRELLKNNCFNLELTLGKNLPTKYDVKFYNMRFLCFPLPIIALWRFFTKYFFYYTNKNIKNILHEKSFKSSKNTIITLKDSTMLIKSLFIDSAQQQQLNNYDLLFNFDLVLKLIQTGNSVTSPFTSFTQYIVDIKNGFLKGKEEHIQFLDKVKIIFEQYSQGKEKFKEKDRSCYYFLKYGNENNDLKTYLTLDNPDKNLKMTNDVNVKTDNPQNYRTFISKYKFKEEEEIGESSFEPENKENFIQKHYTDKDEKNDNDNNDNENNDDKDNLSEINTNHRINNYSHINDDEIKLNINNNNPNQDLSYNKNVKNNNSLYLSLNFLQINYIMDIFSKLSKNYSDNAKYILPTLSIKTQFNEIIYKTSFGVYIHEIDIRICDSQFNAQLFQILINKLMLFYTNNPNNQVLKDGLNKLIKKYSDSSTGLKINMDDEDEKIKKKKIKKKKSNQQNENEQKENEEMIFDSELITKFLLRLNYHNSNQSNNNKNNLGRFSSAQILYNDNKNNVNSFSEEDVELELKNNIEFNFQKNNNIQNNEKLLWEPVLEPMPGKFTYLTTKQNQFIKFEILSLIPAFKGLRKICRQNYFHSLNININERLMENINSLIKDYERINEIIDNKENGTSIVTTKKTLTVLNLTEYFMFIKENSNLETYKDKQDEEEEENEIDSDNEINTDKKKKFDFKLKKLLKNKKKSSDIEDNNIKTKFEFLYTSSKKIHDKDELEVLFQENDPNNDIKNNSGQTSPYYNTRKINEIQQLKNSNSWKIYNIERPSKFFYIQKFVKEKNDINKNDEKEELKKNFDNKASILLKGEHFLVCEIEIDSKSSKKLVTFRSNEGIKNELDFPVAIKFVLKDKAKKSDIKIILYPGKYFFIPPSDLENIKEILIKPFMTKSNVIRFGNNIYPYSDLFFNSQINNENDENKIYIAHCPIKEIRSPADKAERIPINDDIIFGIVKKYQSLENEFLSEQIKEKIDFIKAYQKYNYEQGINKIGDDFYTSKVVSDITYVLTPIMKFYNNLPRSLTIKKEIPLDYNSKEPDEKTVSENMEKTIDVENYIKELNEDLLIRTRKEEKEIVCIQEQYVTISECSYESIKLNKKTNTLYSYNLETVIESGDYISVYEPYILSEKGETYLHYIIKVTGNNINEFEDKDSFDKNDIYENKSIVFDLKPFFFNSIIKSFKKLNDNIMSFPRIIKNSSQTIGSKKGNYFVYSIEVNENYVLNSYFYCPFLFLNCSDMNLQIKHKNYVKTLYCKRKSVIENNQIQNYNNDNNSKDKDKNEFDLETNEINRVVMFNPSKNNNFTFEIGNVTFPIYEEKIDKNEEENESEMNNYYKVIKTINLNSQWKKIQILDISKLGGITVDLTKKKPISKKILNKINELGNKIRNNESESDNDEVKNNSANLDNNIINENVISTSHKNKKSKHDNSKILNEKEEIDQKLTFSLQIKLLPKSTLIFITASIYILNQTQKDIYIYYLPIEKKKNNPIKSYMLKAMSNSKFNYKFNYYTYVQLSYEDKYVNNDRINYSGLIDFSQEELKNKELYIQLGEKKKEPLLVVKIIEINGFKFVLLNQKENVNQYPYLIINKLNNKPIEFKQKENTNDKNNEILNIYKKLDKDLGIEKKIISHRLKEYVEPKNNPSKNNNIINININNKSKDISSNKENQNSIPSNMYYTWEEPLLYDQERNTNILEIKVFGAKFEIDPQEIQKDVTFDQRIISDDKKVYLENIIDDCVAKGKIRIVDKKNEYQYELYKHALILKCTKEGEEPLIFEFQNPQLICERKYNGNFAMKLGMKEWEMLCVSMDETNTLVDQMSLYFKKARDFASNFVIKKHVKNKCIYVELTEKKDEKKNNDDIKQKIKTHVFFNIENICLSFIMKHKEFMYIWFKSVYLYLQKTYGGDNTIIYKQIIFKIKEYQIDNYAKKLYYPIVFSPLSDKRFSGDPYYSNFSIVLNNFQMNADLYQVDLIYVTMMPVDIKLENKFLENLNSFIIKIRMAFDNKKINSSKNLKEYVHEIDNLKFIEYQTLIKPESRIHVKLFCIDEIKTYLSLKFDNIDLFLETSSFLFLKPLIEELGLRILNLESSIFSFPNYIKVNIYQSTNAFMNQVLSFLFQQFIGELIKALGGIHSISSFQLWENLNNNILSSMKNRENSLEQYKSKKSFKEIYRSGYENASTVIGGFFILTYKMMATIGRIFAMMTFDQKYKKKRTYLMNKSVKSLSNGISLSFQLLILAIIYIFAQFYYVPKNYLKEFHFLFAIILSIIIIGIGIFWKPICGSFDLITKIFETLGVSIIDILAERIRIYARFPREIKENNLRDYNSIDALASFAKNCIDKAHSKARSEDVKFAIPGTYNGHNVIILFWLDRILVIRYIGELKFHEEFLLHFSSYDLYFNENNNKNIIQIVDSIFFNKVIIGDNVTERSIEIMNKKRRCCSFIHKSSIIKLHRFENTSYLAKNYDKLIKEIIKNKTEVKERFSK